MKVVNLRVLTTIVIVPNPNVIERATICRRLKVSLARRGKGRNRIIISEIIFITQSAMKSLLFQKVHPLPVVQWLSICVPHQKMAIKGAVRPKTTVIAMTQYNVRRSLDDDPP